MQTFEEAWGMLDPDERPTIILGNGFSQSWNAQIFNYANLLDVADFGDRDKQIRGLFNKFETYDFEAIMRALLSSQFVLEIYEADKDLVAIVEEDQQILKDALLRAISTSHPGLPSEVTNGQYQSARRFLSSFSNIFTVNYDLLMYWARNMSDIQPIEWRTDDGFRAGQLWKGYETDQNVHFLHGGLHIYDGPTGAKKHAYNGMGSSIIEQVKNNLAENRFPLFVSEPTYQKKKKRIENSPYLAYCFRALAEITGSIFIYGHSLDENDRHIFSQVKSCSANKIFVSIYGDENSEANTQVKASAFAYLDRPGRQVYFFDASTAKIWNQA